MTGLAAFLDRCAADPDRDAIIDGSGQKISFGQLAARSGQLAVTWHHRGLRQGDRVLMALPLGIDLYVALAALWRLGAVVVLPEPAMGLKGVRWAARKTRPKAFLASGTYRVLRWLTPALWKTRLTLGLDAGNAEPGPPVELNEAAPALVSFTSGSTGVPKAIQRTHGLLAAQNESISDLLSSPDGPSIDLVAFPVFVLANLSVGNTSVLPAWNERRHDQVSASEVASQIGRHAIRRALVPPSVCEAMIPVMGDLRLDTVFTGGGPVFPDVMLELSQTAPKTNVVIVYGSTEAEPIAHMSVRELDPQDWTRMHSGGGLLVGRPVASIKIRIVDDEIVVSGDHVNKGYLDPRDDADTKVPLGGEVWHRTGDAGYIDAQGRIWLLGRHNARRGSLFPFAVESAARTWPGVRRAALVGRNGEAILAIEGASDQEASWRSAARNFGQVTVARVPRIPLDRRHRSKVDYSKLKKLLA